VAGERESRGATRSPKLGVVFSPVPTAVPPMASSRRPGKRRLEARDRACSSWAT
jgi:hypothetical protein